MGQALTLIKVMVDELEEAYAPYIEDTATAMLKVFDFELGEDVREEAFEVWASLITVAQKTSNTAVLRELLQSLLGRVLQAMETTDDLAWELTQATGLSTCLKAAGPAILQDNEVSTICTRVFKLLRESLERREHIKERAGELWPKLVPTLIECVGDKDNKISQAS